MSIRLNRIYTRSGDQGTTMLVGGDRVPKDALPVEVYGTIDELNAMIGAVRAAAVAPEAADASITAGGAAITFPAMLIEIQNRLFDTGNIFATPAGTLRDGMPAPEDADVRKLEQWMDAMQQELQPLESFVLPGGSELNARLHLARTICRRAERRAVRFAREADVPAAGLVYLNRLSDWLFVASRWMGKRLGESEQTWQIL